MDTRTKFTQAVKDEAVRRALAGEPVNTLAREYGASRAVIYIWIRLYKAERVESNRRNHMSSKTRSVEEKINTRIQVRMLEQENYALKQRVFELMYKHGEL